MIAQHEDIHTDDDDDDNNNHDCGGGDAAVQGGGMREKKKKSASRSTNNTGTTRTTTTTSTSISNIPSLVCAFSASATTGGTSYAFGLYAAALKRSLQLTQGELDSISTAFFVAGLFSWIPGMCSDRLGTKISMSLGGITGVVSLVLYWLVARKFVFHIDSHAVLVILLSTLGVTTFLSCALVTGAVFKIISTSTGPGSKGSAVGAAKGYVGLGAGLFACLFESVRGQSESDLDFLPMAGFFMFCCSTIPALLLLPSKRTLERVTFHDDSTPWHFRILFLSLIALAVVIVLNSMLDLYETGTEQAAMMLASREESPIEEEVLQSQQQEEQQHRPISSSPDTNQQQQQRQPHFGVGLLLVTVWLAPIFALQYMPRSKRNYSDGVILLPDHDEEEEECASSLDEQSDHIELEANSSMDRRRKSQDGKNLHHDALVTASEAAKTSSSPFKGSDDDEEERGLLIAENDSQIGDEEDHHVEDDEYDDEAMDGDGLIRSSDRGIGRLMNEEDDDGVNDNRNLIQMLQTPSAWLMLWTTMVLVGAGTVETNNMGQMVESLGFPSAVTPASLALFSVAQAAGRVMTGSISESALNWNTRRFCIDNGVPRPFFLVVASLLGFLSHFVLGLATTEIIFVLGATLAGAAFGMVWPLMVLITGEVFGTANVGANYMFFDGFTSAAGTLLLTKFVAQDVYEAHIDPHAQDENTCLGMGCFQTTHLAVAGLSLSCVITSFGMLYTTRRIYNRTSIHRASS